MLDHFKDGELTTISLTDSCPQPPDRRQQARHVTVLRVAKITTRHSEQLCLVRNISAGGLMAHIYSDLSVGDPVITEFKSGHAIGGRVLWRRDGLAGIQFNERVNAAHILAGDDYAPTLRQQRAPRVGLNAAARIRIGIQYRNVSLCNISQGGASIRPGQVGDTGQKLVLIVDGLPPIAGTIRWHDCDQAGIEFDIPIPFDVLAQWVPMAHRQSTLPLN
jgi:hypothetical protein